MPQVDAHRLSHVERNSLAFKDERAIFVQSWSQRYHGFTHPACLD